jgi:hypothetical protein
MESNFINKSNRIKVSLNFYSMYICIGILPIKSISILDSTDCVKITDYIEYIHKPVVIIIKYY